MIDDIFARELQPALCTAISSLLEDDILEVVSSRPLEEYGPLGEKIERLGRDIATLGAAMAVIAQRTVIES